MRELIERDKLDRLSDRNHAVRGIPTGDEEAGAGSRWRGGAALAGATKAPRIAKKNIPKNWVIPPPATKQDCSNCTPPAC